VGLLCGLFGNFGHEVSYRVVGEQQRPDFLPDRFGVLRPQQDICATAQTGFDLAEYRFFFPAFMIDGGQFCGRRFGWIENIGG
jgi:hypothetical protein